MKIISLFMLLLLTSVFGYSQAPISKGQLQINAGLGFSGWGVPIYGGVDYGVHPDITIGGELSFRRYNESYFRHDYKHNIIGIVAKGNYHFNSLLKIPNNFDLYGGANLGFYIWNTSDSDYNGSGASELGLGIQIGGRYYFNDKIGINLEFGGASTVSGGKIGVSFIL